MNRTSTCHSEGILFEGEGLAAFLEDPILLSYLLSISILHFIISIQL